MRNKIIRRTFATTLILMFLLLPTSLTLDVLNLHKLACILLILWVWDICIFCLSGVIGFYFDAFDE